jgi:radical SAM superfamily enzyme YgiQ (UPF0313 family)
MKHKGVPIVLTASILEMSDFFLRPFYAFLGGFPLGSSYIWRKILFASTQYSRNGKTKFAPYGLRKVESILIKEFGAENVVTVHPRNLNLFVGQETKVIGISTMDPLGQGFVSRTYSNILGFKPISATRFFFEELLHNRLFKEFKPKIIVGGAGAWQLLENRKLIDTIFIGLGEHSIVNVFRNALRNEKIEKVVFSENPNKEEIPTIRNPSLYGTVEITRGCGKGCAFCSPNMHRQISFSSEHILEEVKLNARNGTKMILLQTDDIFLYQCKSNYIPNRKAITNLITKISKVEGVKFIQIAHASLAPIVFNKNIIEDVAPILSEKAPLWFFNKKWCPSFEVGIETGSPRLMKKYMRGKALPCKTENWQNIVIKAIGILNDNHIYPLATLVVGLPEEEKKDLLLTLQLIDKLKSFKLFFVPLLFTSERESVLKEKASKNLRDLNNLQWDVFARCWRNNITKWTPKLSKLAPFSLLSYPFYMWKHGRKIHKPLMRISGLTK